MMEGVTSGGAHMRRLTRDEKKGALSAFQAGEQAGAKALRHKHPWCFGGTARRPKWPRQPR